jgi:hypothetical protein
MSERITTHEAILQRIRSLPGPKILTLVTLASEFAVDIDADGVCGYEPGHESLFRAKLARALQEGGGLMIRQFLPVKVQRQMPNGKLLWIPEKKLYGLFLGAGEVTEMSDEVRRASCTDAETGAALEPEPGVTYASWEEAPHG